MRDAATFLTRVPLHRAGAAAPDMGASVPWFGAIGMLLGAAQGAIFVGLFEVATPGLAAAVAVTALALVTGAFHHDGLADMADGFGGGWTVEQRLEIMKDSRLGTYGATALVCVILIEVMALASISGWLAVAATVTAHALSRSVATGVMLVAHPAANSGLGVDYLNSLPRGRVLAASTLILGGTATLFGVFAIAVATAAYLSAALIVILANSKIGGITGDVLGAVQQIAKVTILATIVVIAESTIDPGALGGLAL